MREASMLQTATNHKGWQVECFVNRKWQNGIETINEDTGERKPTIFTDRGDASEALVQCREQCPLVEFRVMEALGEK